MARPTLRNHPKFKRLAHILGICEAHALGHLEFLWSVAYESGEEIIGDETAVELCAGWKGENGAMCAALMSAGGAGRSGFIDKMEDGRYKVHDLIDHAPDYVKSRSRMEKYRKRSRSGEVDNHHTPIEKRPVTQPLRNNLEQSVTVTQPLRNGYDSPAPAPAPSSLSLPREEEKSGEQKTKPDEELDVLTLTPSKPIPPELERKVVAAFSAWRRAATGGDDIDPEKNECYPIRSLLFYFINNDSVIGRENLVERATAFCMNAAKEFRSVKYAVSVVRGVIENDEMNQTKARKNRSPPPFRPLETLHKTLPREN